MPKDVLDQLNSSKDPLKLDQFIYKSISDLSDKTKRNTIVYYSGWLQKPGLSGEFSITDADKSGFMACMYGKKERQAGLDLILHTPGGVVGATESLIDYLKTAYNGNIRTIVPQLAMSGGTLMAISATEIVMGAHSSLGPVDPQVYGRAAQLYLDEFNRASIEISKDPSKSLVWQPILAKISPTVLEYCRRSIDWSSEILVTGLKEMMFKDEDEGIRKEKIERIKKLLVDKEQSKDHDRHITRDKAREAGLKIVDLEADQELQDKVLTLHHSLCIAFQMANISKTIASGIANGGMYIFQSKPVDLVKQ